MRRQMGSIGFCRSVGLLSSRGQRRASENVGGGFFLDVGDEEFPQKTASFRSSAHRSKLQNQKSTERPTSLALSDVQRLFSPSDKASSEIACTCKGSS